RRLADARPVSRALDDGDADGHCVPGLVVRRGRIRRAVPGQPRWCCVQVRPGVTAPRGSRLGRPAAIGNAAPIFQPAQAFSALLRDWRRAGSGGESVVKCRNSMLRRASFSPRAPDGAPIFVLSNSHLSVVRACVVALACTLTRVACGGGRYQYVVV